MAGWSWYSEGRTLVLAVPVLRVTVEVVEVLMRVEVVEEVD